jgi:hypothetical protein
MGINSNGLQLVQEINKGGCMNKKELTDEDMQKIKLFDIRQEIDKIDAQQRKLEEQKQRLVEGYNNELRRLYAIQADKKQDTSEGNSQGQK